MVKIQIIVGSIRPCRFGIQPATWLYGQARQLDGVEAELVDLEELSLPFLDEPASPAKQKYFHDHTKQWSERVARTDGFVFVTPEYNHSYSPALKNAIDYLFVEWNYKPVSFLSYGSLAGGARAVEHLRGVAGEVKMYDLRDQILLPNYWEQVDEKGEYRFTDRHVKAAREMLEELAFWAEKMREIRQERAVEPAERKVAQ
jgi:NAD(P)H-dependent FMN reductase